MIEIVDGRWQMVDMGCQVSSYFSEWFCFSQAFGRRAGCRRLQGVSQVAD